LQAELAVLVADLEDALEECRTETTRGPVEMLIRQGRELRSHPGRGVRSFVAMSPFIYDRIAACDEGR